MPLVQSLPAYIPMTVQERLIQTQKNNFVYHPKGSRENRLPFFYTCRQSGILISRLDFRQMDEIF